MVSGGWTMSGIIRTMVKLVFPRTILKPAQPIRQTRNDPGQPHVYRTGVVPKPTNPVPLQE